MPLEAASYIHQLEASNPAATDQLAQADDHLRLIKSCLQATFPGITGPVTATQDELNGLSGLIPAGIIAAWYGSSGTIPSGWALCDGGTYDRSDGSGTIDTPDLRDRSIIGAGTGIAGQGVNAGATTSSVTSGAAGSHTHTASGSSHTHTATAGGTTLSEAQIPAHSHALFVNGRVGNISDVAAGQTAATGTNSSPGESEYVIRPLAGTPNAGVSGNTGGGTSHDHPVTIDAAAPTITISTASDHQHSVSVSTVHPVLGLHHIMKI